MNHTGPGSKILTCRVCGSYKYLMNFCPNSLGNLKRVNMIVDDENVVQLTCYN